jgi:hypothetical protein
MRNGNGHDFPADAGKGLEAGQKLRSHDEAGEDAIMDHGKALRSSKTREGKPLI